MPQLRRAATGEYCPACGQETRIEAADGARLPARGGGPLRRARRPAVAHARRAALPPGLPDARISSRAAGAATSARRACSWCSRWRSSPRSGLRQCAGRSSSDDSTAQGGASKQRRRSRSCKFDAGRRRRRHRSTVPGFTIHVDRDLNLERRGRRLAADAELKKRFEHFNGLNRQEKSEQIFRGVVRYGPYAMFVLLPAFALLQMIAYPGRGTPLSGPAPPLRRASRVRRAHARVPVPGRRAGAGDPGHAAARGARDLVRWSTSCGRRSSSTAADGSVSSARLRRRHLLSRAVRASSSRACCWRRSWCADQGAACRPSPTSSLKRASRVSWRALRFSVAPIAVS